MIKHFLSALIITVIFFFLIPCFGQKKDTLFWYVGTWKNKTTFLIDSNLFTGAKGGSVTVTSGKEINVTNPEVDKYNKKVDEDIDKLEKDAEKISTGILKNEGVSQAGLSKKIEDELQKLKSEVKNLKIRNMEAGTRSTSNNCTAIEATYNEILSYYMAHEKEKKFNLPSPPEADYLDCWSCNKQKQLDFDKKVKDYVAVFARQEREYATSCLQIMKSLQIDLNNGSTPANGVTCAVDGNKIFKMLFWLTGRRGKMCKQLLKEYGKNYKTVYPVGQVCLLSDKESSLLGIPESGIIYEVAALPALLFDTLFKQLTKVKDYSMLAEIPLMTRLNREAGLLSGNPNEDFINETIYSIGRFKLTLEMDIKMGKNGGYILGHLKGKTNLTYELDSTDCLHIVPDWRESMNNGLANKWNSVSMNVIALEMLMPKGSPPKYIGTKTYRSPIPRIKINFCRQGADSVYLNTFNPDPVDQGTWLYVIPNAPPQHVASGLMGVDRLFMDIDDIQNEVQQLSTPPPVDEAALKEIQKLAEDMQKNGVTAAKMKKVQELTQKSMQPAQDFGLSLSNFKFAVNFQNKNVVLIDQSFDAKKINPRLADEIVYGNFKIKLEYLK